MASLRDRSTTDLLILLIAGTICTVVLFVGGAVFVLEVIGGDSGALAGNLSDVVNTLIGLMAGFLAGRTPTSSREDNEER